MQLSANLMKEGLYAGLFQSIDQRFDVEDDSKPFYEWVKGINLDGHPFTYDRHEYLIEPYRDDHPHIVEMKAAQLGLSTKSMLKAIYGARYRGFGGVLYLFPSRSDVLDFSRGRVNPLIEDNPDTIGSWVKDTDSAGMKKVWNCFLYFRGMRSAVGLKSIPADFLILDELDEGNQKAVDMAIERMAHSEFKEILNIVK